MRPLAVVEPQIPADRAACLRHTVIGTQVDLFILDRTPQPLDEHVVAPGPTPIHADPDRVVRQQSGERCAGELAPLVGVEDLRPAMTGQRLVDRIQAEIDLHGDGHPPGQHPSAEPVHHRSQVHEAMGHRYIGDVHRPGLVRPLDRHPAQQVRKHLVPVCRFGRVRPAIHRLDRHPPHHRRDLVSSDRDALAAQQVTQHPAAGERIVEVQLVDPPHDREFGGRHRTRHYNRDCPG